MARNWTEGASKVSDARRRIPFMEQIECITCRGPRKEWYLLVDNAAVREVSLNENWDEGVKSRGKGNRRRSRAGVILCVDIQGLLACKWARICHVKNEFPWIGALTCTNKSKSKINPPRSQRLKRFPKLWVQTPRKESEQNPISFQSTNGASATVGWSLRVWP